MRIAICEDDHELLTELADMLLQKESTCGSYSVKRYTTGDRMWFDYQDRVQPFDMILLDIELPGELNGLQVAQKIRDCGDRVPIVILSAYRKYALAGYSVQPWHYLLKPVDKEQLYSVVDQIEERLQRYWNDCLNLQVAGGYLRIPFDDIYYLENCLHHVLIHTRDACHRQYRKLSEVLTLCDERFLCCHKSYAVNVEKIQRIMDQYRKVQLINGETVPISQQKKPEFVRTLTRYDRGCQSLQA